MVSLIILLTIVSESSGQVLHFHYGQSQRAQKSHGDESEFERWTQVCVSCAPYWCVDGAVEYVFNAIQSQLRIYFNWLETVSVLVTPVFVHKKEFIFLNIRNVFGGLFQRSHFHLQL